MKDRYIVIIAALVAIIILCLTDFGSNQSRVYDCNMAEWHPDIPQKVKEECRKLRREYQIENERLRA